MKRKVYPKIKNESDGNKIIDFHVASDAKAKAKLKPQSTKGEFGSGNEKGCKTSRKRNKKVPDIKYLEKEVLKSIKGQDTQVRQVITAIYRALTLKSIKANVLIIGNSGTGKTAIVKEVAKRLNLPYTIEDATKYTQEGYYGADVVDMVYNLLEAADNNISKAKNGIIIVDEIDKKASNYGYHDVSGAEVLKSMLKIIEGTKLSISDPEASNFGEDKLIEFDTSNIVFIFLGAFSGMNQIIDKRMKKGGLGFISNNYSESDSKFSRKVLKKDLVAYGLPEEFIGRIDTIVEMNKLNKEDLECILKDSRLSIFRKYENQLKAKGITLEYDDNIFESIAEKSLSLDTGARELSNTVNYIFEDIVYQVIACPKKYTKCKLLPGIEEDNTKYKLM